MEQAHTDRRLWKRNVVFTDYDLNEDRIKQVFACFQAKGTPNTRFDAFLDSLTTPRELRIETGSEQRECYDSFKCERLREQSLALLGLIRIERSDIARLISEYEKEKDSKIRVCLQALVRKKNEKVGILETVREQLVRIIQRAERAAGHCARCITFVSASSPKK